MSEIFFNQNTAGSIDEFNFCPENYHVFKKTNDKYLLGQEQKILEIIGKKRRHLKIKILFKKFNYIFIKTTTNKQTFIGLRLRIKNAHFINLLSPRLVLARQCRNCARGPIRVCVDY